MAVFEASSGHGTWQYSLNDGADWSNVGAVDNSAARLLRTQDRLRFVPDGRSADTAALRFYVWDESAGTAGGTIDVKLRGGATPFALQAGRAAITVNATATASPVLPSTPVNPPAGTEATAPVVDGGTSPSQPATTPAADGSAGGRTGAAAGGTGAPLAVPSYLAAGTFASAYREADQVALHTPSILQLLDLIKPKLEIRQGMDINLQLTPLSSSLHVLPSRSDWTGPAGQDGGPAEFKLTKAAGYSTGVFLSIGTIWWTARVSGLLTSVIVSTPAWRAIDPLPVLTASGDEEAENDGDHLGEHEVERLFDADKVSDEGMPTIG